MTQYHDKFYSMNGSLRLAKAREMTAGIKHIKSAMRAMICIASLYRRFKGRFQRLISVLQRQANILEIAASKARYPCFERQLVLKAKRWK
jgi:hypothetical protein